MTTESVSSVVESLNQNNSNKTSDILGKDEFLKILVTQLQNQDPLNPMDDKDFIAQMAQFSALEQMNNLNSSFSLSQAIGLVGKEVVASAQDSVTGQIGLIAGKVECVYSNNNNPLLKVGDYYVLLEAVQAVFEVNEVADPDVPEEVEEPEIPEEPVETEE